jgi:hypothetical protein
MRECRICKSLYRFFEIENQETGKKFYEMLDLHKIYQIPDDERGFRDVFVCKSCVSFIESIVDSRIKLLQPKEKIKEK